MMKSLSDPLLSIGQTVVKTSRNFFAMASALVLFAAPLAIIYDDEIHAGVQQHFAFPDSYYPTGAIVGLLLFVSVVLALWFLFFRALAEIVETVAQGDPFITENTSRLQHMAWLLVIVQLVYIPTAAFGLAVETAFKGLTSEVDVFWDVTGLLMVITLFVLARVFRHGAETGNNLGRTV